jgi:endo-1,4-beta-xylanase
MAQKTLRQAAERCGILIGAACSPDTIAKDVRYRTTLAREFNCIVAENCMKFKYLQPRRGRFHFADADRLVAFAQKHAMRLRGHTLVWHNQVAKWVLKGAFRRNAALDILRTHIFTVLEHFRGKAYCWDVVNEGLDDKGGWRVKSPWFKMIGPDYLAHAFRWAHEADPAIKLVYNDYGMEMPGPKSNGCYRMVRKLLKDKVPLHAVGFQYHLGSENKMDPKGLLANLRRFSKLGLDIQMTEMDMGIKKPITPALRREQADEYANRFRIALNSGAVSAMMFWGFTDRYTWVPAFTKGTYDEPLPFDRYYRPKPAYFAIRKTLEQYDKAAYGRPVAPLRGKGPLCRRRGNQTGPGCAPEPNR